MAVSQIGSWFGYFFLIHVWFLSSFDLHQSCKQAHTDWKKNLMPLSSPKSLNHECPSSSSVLSSADCGVLLVRLFIYLCGFLHTLKPPYVLIRAGCLQSLALLQRIPERILSSLRFYSSCCVESFHSI